MCLISDRLLYSLKLLDNATISKIPKITSLWDQHEDNIYKCPLEKLLFSVKQKNVFNTNDFLWNPFTKQMYSIRGIYTI